MFSAIYNWLFGFNLDFLSLRVHFFNGKNIYLVAVSEKLVQKFSGTSGLEHFRHLSAKSLEIPLQDKIFA